MTAAQQEAVGFIGIGAIGRPMVERMIGAKLELVVHDIRPEACSALAGRAAIAASPAEVASRSAVVFACLPSITAYREAILGAQGVCEGQRAGVYVHVGTTGAALVEEIAAALAGRGVAVLDAPMTGGTPRARAGTLTVMASGPTSALRASETAIGAYANKITHLGERPGMAQVLKLINNMISATNLAIACEGLVMAAKAGLDPARVVEVLNAGTGQNSATLSKIPDHVLTRSFDYGGGMHITLKDLQCYVEEAEARGVPTGIGAAVRSCYVAAAARQGTSADMTEIMCFLEHLAGIAED